MKYTISELYINEAIRLRKKYFDVMRSIYDKNDELMACSAELEKINKYLSSIDVENDKQLEDKIKEQSELLEHHTQRIQAKLRPDYDDLVKIEEDTKILYDSIQEKYKGISIEEIKNQIIPHLVAKEKTKD